MLDRHAQNYKDYYIKFCNAERTVAEAHLPLAIGLNIMETINSSRTGEQDCQVKWLDQQNPLGFARMAVRGIKTMVNEDELFKLMRDVHVPSQHFTSVTFCRYDNHYDVTFNIQQKLKKDLKKNLEKPFSIYSDIYSVTEVHVITPTFTSNSFTGLFFDGISSSSEFDSEGPETDTEAPIPPSNHKDKVKVKGKKTGRKRTNAKRMQKEGQRKALQEEAGSTGGSRTQQHKTEDPVELKKPEKLVPKHQIVPKYQSVPKTNHPRIKE